jgi:hypothetical protein
MEGFAKKIGPWIPLMIAAGYFIFLIATWAKMSQQIGQIKSPSTEVAVIEKKVEET